MRPPASTKPLIPNTVGNRFRSAISAISWRSSNRSTSSSTNRAEARSRAIVVKARSMSSARRTSTGMVCRPSVRALVSLSFSVSPWDGLDGFQSTAGRLRPETGEGEQHRKRDNAEDPAHEFRAHRRRYTTAIRMSLRHDRLELLDRYLRIPTISRQVTPEMVAAVRGLWRGVGLEFSLLAPVDGQGTPALYGELPGPEGAPTLLLYGHYDVQPTGDVVRWQWRGVKCEPFVPAYFLD